MSSPTRSPIPEGDDLVTLLRQKVVGQPSAIQFIVPYVQIAQAGLAPPGRPVGIFLLLGPTGTGKTRTVEVLAEILHGSEKSFVRIDCGEFQLDHEVAKLIGAPPGYLGHRETQAMLNQNQLRAATSDHCNLSIVLFDEIEKAAPSLTRLLLGVLDKATLRLGDNTTVNFEESLIFLTSNLGAEEMTKELDPTFGFRTGAAPDQREVASKLQAIALAAVRKRFSPEFVNRIDAVVTYQPLDENAYREILNHQIEELQQHVNTRLGQRCFRIEVPEASRQFLLAQGTSSKYGARELKRTVHRHLTQPLAKMVALGEIEPGALVKVERADSGLLIRGDATARRSEPAHPAIMIVDDNRDLLRFLDKWMTDAGCVVTTVESGNEALKQVAKIKPAVILIDFLLEEGNGLDLGIKLRHKCPQCHVVLMVDAHLEPSDEDVCLRYGFIQMQKPFLASYAMGVVRDLLERGTPPAANAAR
ncbi:MAG: response regulator [Acidimicrobiia bacterium]|nr:response regulator [Acidimicrobiia bacterium]